MTVSESHIIRVGKDVKAMMDKRKDRTSINLSYNDVLTVALWDAERYVRQEIVDTWVMKGHKQDLEVLIKKLNKLYDPQSDI